MDTKLKLLALVAVLLVTITVVPSRVHAATGLAIDGSATNQSQSNTSASVSLTTTQSPDIILLAVSYTAGSGFVAAVSDTAGLNWSQKAAVSSGTVLTLYAYYATANSTLKSDSITVTFSRAQTVSLIAFGISGTLPGVFAFDPNFAGSLATASGTSLTSPSVPISTLNSNDMIVSALATTSSPAVTPSSGFTLVTAPPINPTAAAEYKVVSTTQTNLQVGYTLSSAQPWAIVAGAFVQAPSLSTSSVAGPVGAVVTLSGSNYTPASEYSYCLSASGRSVSCVGATGTFTSISTGNIPAGTNLIVPSTPGGSHYVIIYSRSTVQASQQFTVTASLTISPSSASPRTSITLSGSGYAPSIIYNYCVSSSSTSVTCVNGTSSPTPSFTANDAGGIPDGVTVTVPSGTVPGGYFVIVFMSGATTPTSSASLTVLAPVGVSLDASVVFQGQTSSTSTLQLNHAANVLVVIWVNIAGAANSVSSVTVGGESAASLTSITIPGHVSEAVWYAYRSSAASESISATLASSSRTNLVLLAASFTGTASSAPFFEGTNAVSGFGYSAVVHLTTSGPGRLVVQSVATSNCPYPNAQVTSLGSGQVSIASGSTSADWSCNTVTAYSGVYGESNLLTGSNTESVTVTATLSSNSVFANIATAILPAPGTVTLQTSSPSFSLVPYNPTAPIRSDEIWVSVCTGSNGVVCSNNDYVWVLVSWGSWASAVSCPDSINGVAC